MTDDRNTQIDEITNTLQDAMADLAIALATLAPTLTQEEVAERLGESRNTVQRLTSKNREPGNRKGAMELGLARLSVGYEMNLSSLLMVLSRAFSRKEEERDGVGLEASREELVKAILIAQENGLEMILCSSHSARQVLDGDEPCAALLAAHGFSTCQHSAVLLVEKEGGKNT